MQSDEPVVVTPDVEQVPWHRQRWVVWTMVVAVTITTFALVAVLIALITWNASSEKALLDAADYALKNPGTYHVQAGNDFDVVARTDGRLYAVDGTLKGAPITAVANSTTLYVKSSDPKKLYDALLGVSASETSRELFGSLLKNLKNQWISFDLKSTSKSSLLFGNIRCFLGSTNAFSTENNTALPEVGSAYLSHPFMTIAKSSPSQYQLTVDGKKLSAFQGAYSQTKTSKELDSCSQTLDSLDTGSLNGAKIKVDLSKSRHVLETLTYEGDASKIVKIKADYGKVEQITAPSNAIDVSQIVGSLIESILGKGGAQ